MLETERASAYERTLMFFSGFFVLFLTVIPVPLSWQAYRPDWVLLFVLYWSLRSSVSDFILLAWGMGILKDVLVGSLLGQHAMIFAIIGYVMLKAERQVTHFSLIQQAIIVIVVSFIVQGFVYFIQRSIAHPPYDFLGFWISAVITGILWPWWVSLLDLFD